MRNIEVRAEQQISPNMNQRSTTSEDLSIKLHRTAMDTLKELNVSFDDSALMGAAARGLITFEELYKNHITPDFLHVVLRRSIREEVKAEKARGLSSPQI